MTPSHLPKLAFVLMLLDELKSWGWGFFAMVLGFAQSGGWQAVAIGAGLVVLCVAFAAVRYWRFTYLIAPDNVTINSGLFVRKVRHIPYTKIQTVQRQQWFFLRPFHLESVTLETSGQEGKGGEASLYAVPLDVATAIEAHRHATAPAPASTEEAVTTVTEPAGPRYRIDGHALNLYALTSLGFLPIIAALLWLVDKLQDLVPKSWQARFDDQMAHAALILIVALVVIILLIGLAASYLNILQRYFHFTLTRTGDTLSATRGLFKTISVSVRLRRIQAVRFKQSLLRHCFHLVTVQALTASNAADSEKENDLVLLPVVLEAQTLGTTREFVDWLPRTVPTLTAVTTNARWYYWRNSLLWTLVWLVPATGAVAYWLPRWLPVAVVLASLWLIWTVAQAVDAARHTAVATQDVLLIADTAGHFARERFFVRRANVQAVTVKDSVWLGPKHLAHLVIDVRAGDSNQAITLKYLPRATVDAILAWYQPQAEVPRLL